MVTSSSEAGGWVLEARGVRKSFGSVVALRDVSVRVGPGSVHALMGGNGSGKSTFAKIMLGVVRPDGGSTRLDGSPVVIGGPADSSRSGVRGTFQETALADDLTVAENILVTEMPTRFGLLCAPGLRHAELVLALDRVGLPSSILERKVRELPLDQRCLVELSRVLRHEPRMLILDELTASLRRRQVDEVGQVLRTVVADGTSVLFVSHRLEEITEFCDGATVLRNGRDVLRTDDVSRARMDELLASMTGEQSAEVGASARKTYADRVAVPAPDEPPLLDVDRLQVAEFDATVSLTAGAGEVVGIAGLGGNGQSELLKSMFGVFGPRGGTVSVDGLATQVRSVRYAVRHGIGYLSGERERDMAFGQRSIRENLEVVANGLRRQIDATPLMDRMKLVAHRRAPMRALSGGNQQKVILGRWLALAPRVLLADDPTRGVDVSTRNEIHALLRELVEQGSSCVVVSSSDDRELAELCDRVYVLHRGAVIAQLRGAEVTEHNIGRAALTGHRQQPRPEPGSSLPVEEVSR